MHCESNGAQTQHHREDIVKMQGEHEPLHEANEHDPRRPIDRRLTFPIDVSIDRISRSEEHTSELQSPCNLVCRLLLEKKKKKKNITHNNDNKMKYMCFTNVYLILRMQSTLSSRLLGYIMHTRQMTACRVKSYSGYLRY